MDDVRKPAAIGWPRVGAFLIDALLIGVAGAILGWTAFDALARMGEAARLIGLVIAGGYFGILTSRMGGGRTLGHRLLKLKVVGRDGRPPELGRALLRALVLVAPFVVNNVSLKVNPVAIAFAIVAATTLVGLGLAQLYLLIFNAPERRLAHDLLTGTAVVRTEGPGEIVAARPLHARVAIGIVATIFVLSVGSVAYFSLSTTLLAPDRSRLAAVEALPEVMSATVGENTTVAETAGTGKTVTHSLVVNARLNRWPQSADGEVARLAQAMLTAGPPAPGQILVVQYHYGFDIGFSSGWKGYGRQVQTPIRSSVAAPSPRS